MGEPGDRSTAIVERETVVACTAARDVWRWWTDPERLVRWMGTRAESTSGRAARSAIEYGNGAVMSGGSWSSTPPRRLVFTWGWEDPAEVVRPGGRAGSR